MASITVKVKNVYGKDLVYPVTYKKEIEILTGKLTLSGAQINALVNLGCGFEVERINEEIIRGVYLT